MDEEEIKKKMGLEDEEIDDEEGSDDEGLVAPKGLDQQVDAEEATRKTEDNDVSDAESD